MRSAVSRTSRRVLSLTLDGFDSARETVILARPSSFAMSAIVGRALPPPLDPDPFAIPAP